MIAAIAIRVGCAWALAAALQLVLWLVQQRTRSAHPVGGRHRRSASKISRSSVVSAPSAATGGPSRWRSPIVPCGAPARTRTTGLGYRIDNDIQQSTAAIDGSDQRR
jgi:hypothetical protein